MCASLDWLASSLPCLSEITALKEGGQKLVFSCRHPEHGPCVLKLIKPWASQRLDRELEAVRRLTNLSSNNVPRVFETGVVESQIGALIWLLEQRVSGRDLSDLLREGPLSREQLLSLALGLVSAAAHAESVDVVHRDIKPDNIKIDSIGNVWLLDFGIARILDLESRTHDDVEMGPHSPGYSAPEQFRYRKRDIGGRSDLFAVGVVLYESAAGSNPFLEGTRDEEEVRRRVERDPLPRLELAWDTGGAFADFVSQLTQKYPHQRPCSCAEALEWLQEIVHQLGGP